MNSDRINIDIIINNFSSIYNTNYNINYNSIINNNNNNNESEPNEVHDYILSIPIYTIPIDDEDVDICPICLDNNDHESCTLPCRHHFHKKCLTKWLIKKKQCPICRSLL